MHYIDEITHFIGTDQICSFVLCIQVGQQQCGIYLDYSS